MPPARPTPRAARDTLRVKLGSAFEARATGWGVLALLGALALVLGAASLDVLAG